MRTSTFDWQEAVYRTKDVWKFDTTESGGRCAMTPSARSTPE